MKKTFVILLCMMLFFLPGCSELDEGVVLDASVNVDEKVDVSSIEYPSEVNIYQMDWWEADTEKICDTLLHGEITEIQTQWATGPAYLTDIPGDEILYINTNDGPQPASFIYGYKYNGHDDSSKGLDAVFPTLQGFRVEFEATSQLKGNTDGDSDINDVSEIIKACFQKMDIPEFALRGYAQIPSADGTSTDLLSYWQQVVDQIPISICSIDLHSGGSQNIYNRNLAYDPDLYCKGSYTEIQYVDDEIVSIYVSSIVDDFEHIGTIRPVSPQRAWEKVKNDVYRKREAEDAVLELVELQYLHLTKNGQKYLYPVWTIEVIEKDENEVGGIAYNYYLIDAATGDYFVGLNTY